MVEIIEHNASALAEELKWLEEIIEARLAGYTGHENGQDIFKIPPPEFSSSKSYYAEFVSHYSFGFSERLALILSLAPHIKPEILDKFLIPNEKYNRGYTEFGGIKGQNHGGFLPTGETLTFLLASNNLQFRFLILSMFEQDHIFSSHDILKLEAVNENEPLLSGMLKISQEYLSYFTTGREYKPDFNSNFPAKCIQTDLEWKDLVLDEDTLNHVDDIKAYIDYGKQLMSDANMKLKFRPGFRCMFYGPPGTGKTLTACLLGKYTGKEVYKIDLSMVISKYVGETEKNLAKVFQKAENKDWILFFDEADALFGKRTKVEDAHDRFANQEVSYLLQRIEDYNGVVLLASNMKSNLDDAFARRFEAMVHFPMPKAEERYKIWTNGFSRKCKPDKNVDLREIARNYEIPGGAIINIIRYASIMAYKNKHKTVQLQDIEKGIKKEFHKEGRTV